LGGSGPGRAKTDDTPITLRTVVGGAALTALLTSGAAFTATATFSDVPEDHPFADKIAAITEIGITSSAPDSTFSPDDEVIRCSMAAFLSRGLAGRQPTAAQRRAPRTG